MSAAFTPGPWTVTDNSWETSTVYSHDGHGVVAKCPIDNNVDEQTQDHLERIKEANARLIASAPELYVALGVCVATAERALKASMNLNGDSPYDIAMRAIARARGEA